MQQKVNVPLTHETHKKLELLAERLSTTEQSLITNSLKELLDENESTGS
jgi:predicted transcriptional regulator